VPEGIISRMGKTLYLLRHAKSSWQDPALADHDRPLASRGRRASRAIADHLGRQRIAPTLVLCSSSARTRETLERLSAGLGDEIDVRIEEDLYTASASDLLDRLHEVDTRADSVMLISHEPAIRELALILAGSGLHLERLREKFPTAALATLTFQGSWGELTPGAAELVAFVKPRELEGS
jgi:phosphohistidine phosphatase